jgi:hypothetical protein
MCGKVEDLDTYVQRKIVGDIEESNDLRSIQIVNHEFTVTEQSEETVRRDFGQAKKLILSKKKECMNTPKAPVLVTSPNAGYTFTNRVRREAEVITRQISD